jgi:hypothetical protein
MRFLGLPRFALGLLAVVAAAVVLRLDQVLAASLDSTFA